MTKVEPQSKVIFYTNTGINKYADQKFFGTIQEQETWFATHTWRTYDDFQYVRHGGFLVIPESYDNMLNADYLSFSNDNWRFKEFYAFILNIEYVNDGATRVDFALDCFQTWMFDIVYDKRTFVQNAHVADIPFYQWDTNVCPEGLEFGTEYLIKRQEIINLSGGAYLIASSIKLDKTDFGSINEPILKSSSGGVFDRCPSALDYYFASINGASSIYAIMRYLSNYPWISQGIQSITFVPNEFINFDGCEKVSLGNSSEIYLLKLNTVYVSNYTEQTFVFSSGFGTDLLQKLYTYPYAFVEMSAYNGQSFIIKPQNVNSDSFTVRTEFVIGANPRICSYIVNYLNGTGRDLNKFGEYLYAGISLGNLPQFPILKDGYLMTLANTAYQRNFERDLIYENADIADRLNVADSIVKGANDLTSLNFKGLANDYYQYARQDYLIDVNTSQSIRRVNQAVTNASVTPPSLQGTTGGDTFNIAKQVFGITLKWKMILPQYQVRISNFFKRYGYTINEFRDIRWLLTGNTEVNYVKTVNCHLSGNIPKEDINELEQVFDAGISLWHTDIGDWRDNPRKG